MPTILPTQLGTTIYSDGSANIPASQSQIFIGKDITAQWEAVGFGSQGRPDAVENVILNLTLITNSAGGPSKKATISLKASDINSILKGNTNIPNPVTLSLMEVDVCNNGTAAKMLVISSVPYAPAGNNPQ